ncbi:hypothetical protein JAK31_02860 [Stenotrophomonas maltophilia]|uniref:hypothetical protein n=1 Tax=Stenotrophomonas maltophilia TaxID=40324 RepID=UPI0021C9CF43|nr:hypothetical protein [Stenotrophomonas maltophilia]MCU1181967.1 hypothetical protein [Stenotrophomonas maltophilia]
MDETNVKTPAIVPALSIQGHWLMDKKDLQVVASGKGSQEKAQPRASGAGFLSPATGLEVGPKASRGRHSRRQTLEKGMEDERHKAQVVSMEAFKAGRVGQIPPELLDMYDQLTRDQHALVRTSFVLLAAMRRRLGLPDL